VPPRIGPPLLVTISTLCVVCIFTPLHLQQHADQFSTRSSAFWNSKAQVESRAPFGQDSLYAWQCEVGCLCGFVSAPCHGRRWWLETVARARAPEQHMVLVSPCLIIKYVAGVKHRRGKQCWKELLDLRESTTVPTP
jgi:hypothetical protein